MPLDTITEMFGTIVMVLIGLFVLITLASSVRLVRQSTQSVVERLGRYQKVMHSGLNFIVPFVDRVRSTIDMREQLTDFPPQPVITKDNVTMQIDTVVYYQVTDVAKYVYEIANPRSAIEFMAATTLRNIIGELDLDETLTSRETINSKLRLILDEATDKWGIKVNRVEVKNIIPPRDIQDAMEKQMRAERERRSAVLRAEGEKQAAILSAEGMKISTILQSEANREKEILRAEGEKQKRILEADGQAEAILRVQNATAEGLKLIKLAGLSPDHYIMLQGIEAMKSLGQSPSSKLIIPSDAVKLLGAIPAIVEALGMRTSEPAKPVVGSGSVAPAESGAPMTPVDNAPASSNQ